jgi:hypothetical protein
MRLLLSDHGPAHKLCCIFVSVQTKSEPRFQACREYEQHHFKFSGGDARESERPNLVIALRQIVAKTQSKPALKYRRRLSKICTVHSGAGR